MIKEEIIGLNDNTTNYKNLNLYNYFSFWVFTWFVLYKLNITKLHPFFPLMLIFIPSFYMFIKFYINSKFSLKKILLCCSLIIIDYLPFLYLVYIKDIKITTESIFVTLILMNIYFFYIRQKNLDVNSIYNDAFFFNNLI